MYKEVRCPNCYHLLTAAEIDLIAKKGDCPSCKVPFSLRKTFDYQIRLKNEILQPDNFETLIIPGSELDLRYKFYLIKGFPRINNFIFKLIAARNLLQGCMLFIFLPFFLIAIFDFLLHPAFFILYVSLAVLFMVRFFAMKNQSEIGKVSIKDNILKIENPEFKLTNKLKVEPKYEIKCEDIDQLFVTEHKEKLSLFQLAFRLKDGTKVQPFYPFIDVKEALYIEQMIELFLNIKDSRDPEEIRL